MGKYFGTDGFRGEANATLTAEHAYKIGRFLGWYYGRQREAAGQEGPARVIIGKDTRRSCYMLEYALASGLTASGADACLMHVTTTPSVAYIARTDGFDCGVMISASHNPYYDNGIKLINKQGEKMDECTIALLEDYLDGALEVDGQRVADVPYARRERIGRTVDYIAGRNRYVGYLIALGVFSFRGVKVGLDCANGSAWSIARAVFEALGGDGGGHQRRAGRPQHQPRRRFHAYRGAAKAGGGKGAGRGLCLRRRRRPLPVRGRKGRSAHRRPHTLHLRSYMKKRGKLLTNTVITTVMSNLGLYKAFDELGINYAQTAVGDKYVHEYMAAHGNHLGGEQSGHIIFSKYASTGDGILTSLKMMQAMLDTGKTMHELAAPLKIYPQVLKNVRVHNKAAAQADPAVRAAVEAAAQALGQDGRILVRESGTEPVIRVMVEAGSLDVCHHHVDAVAAALRAAGHVVD